MKTGTFILGFNIFVLMLNGAVALTVYRQSHTPEPQVATSAPPSFLAPSTAQLSMSYLQLLPLRDAEPPADHCASKADVGTMVLVNTGDLFLCQGAAPSWGQVAILKNNAQ